MALPCAALNGLNWRALSAERVGQQVDLDAGLDSVVMMQTVATPLKEQEGFAHFAFDDDVDDKVDLDAGLDSVVMMQTVATPLKEQEGFAHFAFDDDVDDKGSPPRRGERGRGLGPEGVLRAAVVRAPRSALAAPSLRDGVEAETPSSTSPPEIAARGLEQEIACRAEVVPECFWSDEPARTDAPSASRICEARPACFADSTLRRSFGRLPPLELPVVVGGEGGGRLGLRRGSPGETPWAGDAAGGPRQAHRAAAEASDSWEAQGGELHLQLSGVPAEGSAAAGPSGAEGPLAQGPAPAPQPTNAETPEGEAVCDPLCGENGVCVDGACFCKHPFYGVSCGRFSFTGVRVHGFSILLSCAAASIVGVALGYTESAGAFDPTSSSKSNALHAMSAKVAVVGKLSSQSESQCVATRPKQMDVALGQSGTTADEKDGTSPERDPPRKGRETWIPEDPDE
ncbi:unnamed protein product [Prorocentrum cordatum]|uniref:EGF-like domain-containing protein n=1 Tax=Prorocentrum cordatum TaxID=2364126 RepID=A0ABN9VF43_9DINO|nr:unnamed protein product [Polarella glacialis]